MGKPSVWFPHTPSIGQSLALDLRRMEFGESTIEYVGADALMPSEEACSIPFPPGRRKLHIRSLLLPSQIVTVSLGHNLAIWNFTTPHAILMMADIFLPVNRSEIFSYILPVFLRFVNGAEAAVYFAGPQRRSALLRQLRDGTEAIALRAQLVNRCQRRVHRAFVQIVH